MNRQQHHTITSRCGPWVLAISMALVATAGCGNGTLHQGSQRDSGLRGDSTTVVDEGPGDTRLQPDHSGYDLNASDLSDGGGHPDASEPPDARTPPDGSQPPDAGNPPPPVNVVLIILDDLGWTDLGSYGSSFYETPSIDRLAAEGTRFTQAYAAAPMCSPMRASLMTGKHPARLHLTTAIGVPDPPGKLLPGESVDRLPLGEVTIGEAFKAGGYTTGYIGKWHLGTTGFMPKDQGFDFALAVNHTGNPGSYFYPYSDEDRPRQTDVPDLEDGDPGEYLTDRLTDEALRFLQRHREDRFLLVLSHYAVHAPFQSKASLTDKYTAKAARLPPLGGPPTLPEGPVFHSKQRQDHPVFAGMIESADQSVGRVLNKLRELRIDSRTVVVFVSDNGALSTGLADGPSWRMPATSVLPLRGGKGWLYEGGIRVPLIVKWPGVTKKGHKVHTATTTMDLYPTLLQMAGLPQRPSQHRDGVSLVPLLRRTGKPTREALHWHRPHYHPRDPAANPPASAIRVGNYKLIEYLEDNRVELFDFAKDIGESKNLAQQMPAKANELRTRLHQWRTRVDAHMLRPK